MSETQNATLVTGVSRRIGLALGSAILGDGNLLVGHSRFWDKQKIDAFSETTGSQAGKEWFPWAFDFEGLIPSLPDINIKHLVLNASMFERGSNWNDLSSTQTEKELLQKHLQVNLIAQWELAVAVAARGHLESIVMVIDTYYDRPLPGYAAYQVSRAAGAGLVRALASELSPVRVNAVAPGTVLWSERPEYERAESDCNTKDRSVLGKMGSPADVVDAVMYLLNAPYVTGQILRVDGGRWKP